MNGIILIDKEKTWTSRDVVNKVSSILKTKKVGHVGSLDPFATGLLIVTVNNATKIGQFLEALDKIYIAKLKLGEKKDTADVTGETIETKEVPSLSKEKIEKVFTSFLGERKQLPPMYSAIKVSGVPLYKYAREGKDIERKEKTIVIQELRLLSFDNDEITFLAHVSKGTYVRTLGEDIANSLGTVGYLEELIRTKVGSFTLDKACKISELNESRIVPIMDSLPNLSKIVVYNEQKKKVLNGMTLSLDCKDKNVLLVSANNEPLAIYELLEDNMYHCKRGI